jgi:hypothetical protein
VQLVGVGETWRRGLAKCVLLVAGDEANKVCGINQLCAGLDGRIKGGIHAMQHIWDAHHMEEELGFLIIDARNTFIKQNRTVVLWVVHHEWPSAAYFTFNCYHHWCILVIRGKDGFRAIIILSKEGVVQGDPHSMFAYYG